MRPSDRSRDSQPRARLSVPKKALFSFLATALFFLVLELVLAASGVRPILYDEDPYVGFSSRIPLFVEQNRPDGQTSLVTGKNKLEWFQPQEFLKDKPAETFRVFCVGGSTTYGTGRVLRQGHRRQSTRHSEHSCRGLHRSWQVR